jgi:hypothetical protein
MLQAAILDCDAFDPLSFAQDFGGASVVDVGRREIIQALVIAAMIVVLDEGGDLRLQIARQVIFLEQDAVLERLMPALDLALRLRMSRCAAHMRDVAFAQPFRQIARDVGGAIVRQQARPMDDVDLIM